MSDYEKTKAWLRDMGLEHEDYTTTIIVPVSTGLYIRFDFHPNEAKQFHRVLVNLHLSNTSRE